MLDSPTKGEIFIDDININKLNNKKRNEFRKNHFSYVFQSYHLINHLSVIDNVIINLLIRNYSYKKAYKIAKDNLIKLGIEERMFNKPIYNCSGGEKQRIAIARSLVSNPKIIFFDEPTGALDEVNSKNIMEIISSLKNEHLCILVSHDEKLIEQYSDEVIELDYGKVIKVTKNNKIISNRLVSQEKYKRSNKFSSFLYKKNIHKRNKNHLFLSFSFSLAMSFFILIFSFNINRANISIEQGRKQLDYPSLTLTKEKIVSLTSSSLKLVKTIRPNKEDVSLFKNKSNNKYVVDYNLDYLLTSSYLYIGENNFDDYMFSCVYSFKDSFIDKNLLIKGRFPTNDNFNEILINETLYNSLIKNYNFYPLDLSFDISINTPLSVNFLFEEEIKNIEDVFLYNSQIKIVGVVKDFSFLSNKKIYYSYLGLKDELKNHLLNNLSKEMEFDINVYDYFSFLTDNNYETSYSYRIFLKDYKNIQYIKDDISLFSNELKIVSLPYEKEKTFTSLLDVSNIGLNLFLSIAFISLLLLMVIAYYSFILKDRKEISIYLSLGAFYKEIEDTYIKESLFVGFISFFLSFIFALIEQILINKIIEKYLNISSFLFIPFFKLFNIPFLLPLFILSINLLSSFVSIYIPLMCKRKISLSKELRNND